jgi:transcriptional regulator with XRE-family HTH domain
MPLTLEIFRSGKHPSADGRVLSFSGEDLDEIVETFDASRYRPPLVLTPSNDHVLNCSDSEAPATPLCHGIPSRLRREGDKLLAEFDSVSDSFTKWLEQGLIPGFSSSFYMPGSSGNPRPGKKVLRHIASVLFPAVKGMEVPSFSEGGSPVNLSEDEGIADFTAELKATHTPCSDEGQDDSTETSISPQEKPEANLVSKQDLAAFTEDLKAQLHDLAQASLAQALESKGLSALPTEYSSGVAALASEYKRSKNLSLAEFADQVGLTPSGLSRILNGSRQPSDSVLSRLGSVLGVSPDTLALLSRTKLVPVGSTVEPEQPVNLSETTETTMTNTPEDAKFSELEEQTKQLKAELEAAKAQNAEFSEALRQTKEAAKAQKVQALISDRTKDAKFPSEGLDTASFSEATPKTLAAWAQSLTDEQLEFFTAWSATLPGKPKDDPALFNEYTHEDQHGIESGGVDPIQQAIDKARASYSMS